MLTAFVIFALTYAGVALTRLPWIRVDRPSAAFLGAVAMLLFGVLTPQEAVRAVDWDTIALLFGMMVLVNALTRDGHVERVASAFFGASPKPRSLLTRVVLITSIASALVVNDTAVLVLTPVVIAICAKRGLNPVPYLIAVAMASNIGGVPSAVGNPQNVFVVLKSGISFVAFFVYLLPVAVISTAALLITLNVLYRRNLRAPVPGGVLPAAQRIETPPARRGWLSVATLILVLAGFVTSHWTGLGLPVIALAGAAVIVFGAREPSAATLARVDWVLLLFFVGLFVVMGGVGKQSVFQDFAASTTFAPSLEGISALHGLGLVLSQIISNVPATILIAPVLESPGSDLLWLSLASGATLAGNLTLIGAVANLIVAQSAESRGVRIDFWSFTRAGLIVAPVTVAASVGVLAIEQALGLVR